MIKVRKYSCPSKEGFYNQKLIMEDGKIIDAECNCTWGKIHQHAWKKDEKICKHIKDAIISEEMKIKNGKKD